MFGEKRQNFICLKDWVHTEQNEAGQGGRGLLSM